MRAKNGQRKVEERKAGRGGNKGPRLQLLDNGGKVLKRRD